MNPVVGFNLIHAYDLILQHGRENLINNVTPKSFL